MKDKEHNLREEFAALAERLQDPGIYTHKDYPRLAKRQSELERTLGLFDEQHRLQDAYKQASELVNGDDAELAALAADELHEAETGLAVIETRLAEALTPKDPN